MNFAHVETGKSEDSRCVIDDTEGVPFFTVGLLGYKGEDYDEIYALYVAVTNG